MPQIRTALLSVSDKKGIVEFAQGLRELDVEIIASAGTARVLNENGIPTKLVSDLTGFGEMLRGRVKTLHPKIFGALLALRDDTQQMDEARQQGLKLIDLLVVNLYPFAATVQKPEASQGEILDAIDIGGPAMIRAAAKNYHHVAVVIDPGMYNDILTEMRERRGEISQETALRLAAEAFNYTARYDARIATYLDQLQHKEGFPGTLSFVFEKIQDLRYGENPHQRAAFYRYLDTPAPGVIAIRQLHGKQLSFNNIRDLDAAWNLTREFDAPCSVVIKHTNPCGVAVGEDLVHAYRKALATDPHSAFGGILGFNQPVDVETAEEISKMFTEVVIAPGFQQQALEILCKKKNIRLVACSQDLPLSNNDYDLKKVAGGFLLQDQDLMSVDDINYKVVTKRAPTADELKAMEFAWKVVKWVKSNAVVFATEDCTVGIGAGQMSRVDAAELAIWKAKKSGLSLKGTVVASDAFFPFRDGVDVAVQAGATAIIQPGGSVRDQEVIAAADERGLTMVFTGVRHFRH